MAFSKILHPNRYHGFGKQGAFFGGWYYKLVSADEKNQLAVIPGVYIGKDQESSHSFVQVFYSNTGEVRFHRYAFDAFRAARDAFEVHVGPNTFKSDFIQLAIDDELGLLQGTVRFVDPLNARLEVRFEDLQGKVLFEGTGMHAGLETVGDLENLVAMVLKG